MTKLLLIQIDEGKLMCRHAYVDVILFKRAMQRTLDFLALSESSNDFQYLVLSIFIFHHSLFFLSATMRKNVCC